MQIEHSSQFVMVAATPSSGTGMLNAKFTFTGASHTNHFC